MSTYVRKLGCELVPVITYPATRMWILGKEVSGVEVHLSKMCPLLNGVGDCLVELVMETYNNSYTSENNSTRTRVDIKFNSLNEAGPSVHVFSKNGQCCVECEDKEYGRLIECLGFTKISLDNDP